MKIALVINDTDPKDVRVEVALEMLEGEDKGDAFTRHYRSVGFNKIPDWFKLEEIDLTPCPVTT